MTHPPHLAVYQFKSKIHHYFYWTQICIREVQVYKVSAGGRQMTNVRKSVHTTKNVVCPKTSQLLSVSLFPSLYLVGFLQSSWNSSQRAGRNYVDRNIRGLYFWNLILATAIKPSMFPSGLRTSRSCLSWVIPRLVAYCWPRWTSFYCKPWSWFRSCLKPVISGNI